MKVADYDDATVRYTGDPHPSLPGSIYVLEAYDPEPRSRLYAEDERRAFRYDDANVLIDTLGERALFREASVIEYAVYYGHGRARFVVLVDHEAWDETSMIGIECWDVCLLTDSFDEPGDA